jgi:hypothetical protein
MLKSLTDITAEDLKEIERLAELFFTPKEIAIMLEVSTDDILSAIADENSEVYRSFYSGRLQSEVELRRSVVKLAKSGSSPAQTMALDLLNKSKVKMLDR